MKPIQKPILKPTVNQEGGTFEVETFLAENAHRYPQHRRYLAVTDQITGAIALAAQFQQEGLTLCRPKGKAFQYDEAVYWDGQISGEILLAAFGISYRELIAEKEAMLRQAESLVQEAQAQAAATEPYAAAA